MDKHLQSHSPAQLSKIKYHSFSPYLATKPSRLLHPLSLIWYVFGRSTSRLFVLKFKSERSQKHLHSTLQPPGQRHKCPKTWQHPGLISHFAFTPCSTNHLNMKICVCLIKCNRCQRLTGWLWIALCDGPEGKCLQADDCHHDHLRPYYLLSTIQIWSPPPTFLSLSSSSSLHLYFIQQVWERSSMWKKQATSKWLVKNYAY